MNHNLILDNEDVIGRLDEIIKYFKEELKEVPNDDAVKEDMEEALNEAIELNETDYNEHYWRVWFHPMGAFVFSKLVEEEN